jgi:hypothetical protein
MFKKQGKKTRVPIYRVNLTISTIHPAKDMEEYTREFYFDTPELSEAVSMTDQLRETQSFHLQLNGVKPDKFFKVYLEKYQITHIDLWTVIRYVSSLEDAGIL